MTGMINTGKPVNGEPLTVNYGASELAIMFCEFFKECEIKWIRTTPYTYCFVMCDKYNLVQYMPIGDRWQIKGRNNIVINGYIAITTTFLEFWLREFLYCKKTDIIVLPDLLDIHHEIRKIKGIPWLCKDIKKWIDDREPKVEKKVYSLGKKKPEPEIDLSFDCHIYVSVTSTARGSEQ